MHTHIYLPYDDVSRPSFSARQGNKWARQLHRLAHVLKPAMPLIYTIYM